ncbi:efflux transporter outer membrane subunit [Uliginosibacterium sp. H1]|uniref:efflux transporter outer membrane subunit n=1 Tax=Uliginosibacterium sp. H1 TaxID=3114757 RepID=UPI002E172D01|nr:efflux transporter outer membrane subunit [Uliginosibacterium sp. H1]
MPRKSLLAALPLVVLLSACATTYQPAEVPKLALPEPATAAAATDLSRWWQRFDDPALTALIERALQHNTDLRMAVARVDEAAAQLRFARGDQWPDMNVSATAARERASAAGVMSRPSGTPYLSNNYDVSLNVAYEVDLWGRVRNASNAALSRLVADREAVNALRSALAAQVARTYFNLRALDQTILLAERTVATREDAVGLLRKAVDAGLRGDLDLRQAEAQRDVVASRLPGLRSARARTERALALLAGDSPRAIVESRIAATDTTVLPAPPEVPAGLPSDLLARRPDIREAEARLSAAQADVKSARARYYPTIVLTGSYGSSSADLSDLFTGPAVVWRLAAGLVQPIFGLNKIDAQVDAAKARQQQVEAGYVGTVQNAFKEVYDALGSLEAANATLRPLSDRVTALNEALRISRVSYRSGSVPFLQVLDAERALLEAQTEEITTRQDRMSATVDVFRALGGGWSIDSQATAAR